MNNSITKRFLTKNKGLKRQLGLTAAETTIAIIMGVVISAVLYKTLPEMYYGYKNYQLVQNVTDIEQAVTTWKAGRSNISNVSMTELCSEGQEILNKTICNGTGGSGANANPFGGSYTLSVDSNVSRADLVIDTLPEGQITAIADKLAGLTYDKCQSSDDCDSLTVSSDSITMVF
ncbi:hypothetical protein LDJ79_00935 [Vibrio tritonius]|uniref:Uncharacterized protein n=1 Tax=Vibrio tritonius TaxID=1435069 RepID=A0ABS7YG68_9VIBR|nr:hypothetical protein [Vibrio tritonius]MCA2014654.1 hypothetical protein [Vibrio tritonius]